MSVLNRVVFFMLTGLIGALELNGGQGREGDRPDLVVGIVVDRMRFDYVDRMWDMFGDDGFQRLFSGGISFTNARYSHMVNQSASGYATIVTGSDPSVHGIIAGTWYDRLRNELRNPVYDGQRAAVGGTFQNGMRSPLSMMSGTFGDELRMSADFRSRFFSVSLNDDAAILAGGYSANTSWWYDNVSGSWMTSTFYIDSLPSWVKEFNNAMLPDTYLGRVWEPVAHWQSYRPEVTGKSTGPFRHDLRRMRRRGDDYRLMRRTPYGNTFTGDFVQNLIINEGLGKGGSTDVIMIGFAATAEIGRYYGTFSAELQDAYIRLDRDIAHLLRFLDDHLGRTNVLVFLTSDSGAGFPETYRQTARQPSGIFSPGIAMTLLRSYLNVSYGEGDWVQAYNAGMVYLNHDLIERSNIPLAEIQERGARFLVQLSGVAGAVSEDVLSRNFFNSGINARVQSGFHRARSGDIMIYLRQGWYERSVSGDGIELVDYDPHVPLVFYGWNMEHNEIKREVSVRDIVPTVSILLNIPRPAYSTGSPLLEIIR